MNVRKSLSIFITLLMLTALVPPSFAQDEVDLQAIKDYSLEQVATMSEATSTLAAYAERYYAVLEQNNFDYEAAWENNGAELGGLIQATRDIWITASNSYEFNEGIVAGVPSLSYYDVWLDAGPSGEEGGEDALDWQLELPDGRVLEKPGNFFHHLTEPALWGTHEDYVGLAVDLNNDGEVTGTEVLPEANILVASLVGLNDATQELQTAITEWNPTVEDVFVALTTMIPTMSEYFGQWKESAFIAGDDADIESFVAVSRLVDIAGILNGLDIAYTNIAPLVEENEPELHEQISAGFADLIEYVDGLRTDEAEGTLFTAEEVDFFGTEAQGKAEALAALVAQAATAVGVDLS